MWYYIASGLANIEAVKTVQGILNDANMACTYNWTEHGSVWERGRKIVENVAKFELDGVAQADVVIVLLPGGRGTHVELGAALAFGKPVVLVGTPEEIVDINQNTCAFYHHHHVLPWTGPLEALPAAVRFAWAAARSGDFRDVRMLLRRGLAVSVTTTTEGER
jgi:hypothetical protein